VYLALLHDPGLGIADCARDLDISAQRCRAAVRRLIAAGLLESNTLVSHRPRPVDPRVALGSLIRERQGELHRLAADVDQLATDFYVGRLRADPEMVIDVVEGVAATSGRLRDLLSSAEQDVVRLDLPPRVVDIDEGDSIVTNVLGRGVQMRSLYPTDVLNDPDMLACIAAMTSAGAYARFLPTLPLKLFLVDRRTAMVPLTGSEDVNRFRVMVIQRSAITDALYALFELLWRQATNGPTSNGARLRLGGGPGLTDEEQSLLRYLVSGMKDEAIARYLGCSRRTLRRRVDMLLDTLNATSRFQAGALAAQRGWL
jgi:DNA-binding CsgD family transcriptional regulator